MILDFMSLIRLIEFHSCFIHHRCPRPRARRRVRCAALDLALILGFSYIYNYDTRDELRPRLSINCKVNNRNVIY